MMGLLRVLALLVLFCGVAAAQPKPSGPPTTQQKADIDRLAKRAITKSQANDHEGAIKDLLDAYAIHPVAANVLLSNVAHEYKQLKKPYEALKYFCMYLAAEPSGAAATYVKAETEVLKKDLKLEGEACAVKPDPKPDLKPDLKPDPNPNTQLTGTRPIDKPKKGNAGGTLKLAGIGVGVVGAAVLAGGIVFGVKAKTASDAISKGPPPVVAGCNDPDPLVCPRIPWDPPNAEYEWAGHKQLTADGEKYEKMQIALTAIGGALVIGGTAMYFVGRKKSNASSEVRVTASATRNTAGLVLVGGF